MPYCRKQSRSVPFAWDYNKDKRVFKALVDAAVVNANEPFESKYLFEKNNHSSSTLLRMKLKQKALNRKLCEI